MTHTRQFAVYLLTSRQNGTLYTGVTSNLPARTWQHREHLTPGFTARHNVTRLVWFELHDSAETAITREKRIKKWNRAWKIQLIEQANPTWRDLYPEIASPWSIASCQPPHHRHPRKRGDPAAAPPRRPTKPKQNITNPTAPDFPPPRQ